VIVAVSVLVALSAAGRVATIDVDSEAEPVSVRVTTAVTEAVSVRVPLSDAGKAAATEADSELVRTSEAATPTVATCDAPDPVSDPGVVAVTLAVSVSAAVSVPKMSKFWTGWIANAEVSAR
jgi:hypothetical protein